jgi:hypothetical protein
MPPRRTARSVTLDTNVLEADEIIKAGRRCGFEISVVTVTGREVEKSSYKAHLKNLGTVLETAVWDDTLSISSRNFGETTVCTTDHSYR